jgi:hypothetical protein
MPTPIPSSELIEKSKALSFYLHWYLWQIKYRDDLSVETNKGYGYRAGTFFQNGARYGNHHDDWPAFFDVMASLGLTMLSIEALFCYFTYPSCRAFIDTLGSTYIPP